MAYSNDTILTFNQKERLEHILLNANILRDIDIHIFLLNYERNLEISVSYNLY